MSPESIALIEAETKRFASLLDERGREVFEQLCVITKELVELCTGFPPLVAADFYVKALTLKPDSEYLALVTAALYTNGADYDAMQLAINMVYENRN